MDSEIPGGDEGQRRPRTYSKGPIKGQCRTQGIGFLHVYMSRHVRLAGTKLDLLGRGYVLFVASQRFQVDSYSQANLNTRAQV